LSSSGAFTGPFNTALTIDASWNNTAAFSLSLSPIEAGESVAIDCASAHVPLFHALRKRHHEARVSVAFHNVLVSRCGSNASHEAGVLTLPRHSDLLLLNSSFVDCVSGAHAGGGAFAQLVTSEDDPANSLTIERSSFVGCRALRGGALSVSQSRVRVRGSSFVRNSVKAWGVEDGIDGINLGIGGALDFSESTQQLTSTAALLLIVCGVCS
jgi:hypothetical protein